MSPVSRADETTNSIFNLFKDKLFANNSDGLRMEDFLKRTVTVSHETWSFEFDNKNRCGVKPKETPYLDTGAGWSGYSGTACRRGSKRYRRNRSTFWGRIWVGLCRPRHLVHDVDVDSTFTRAGRMV